MKGGENTKYLAYIKQSKAVKRNSTTITRRKKDGKKKGSIENRF
jgi:hypothetical protein